jgi:hypothetical protein
MHWQGDVDVGPRQNVAAGVLAPAVEELSVVAVYVHGTLACSMSRTLNGGREGVYHVESCSFEEAGKVGRDIGEEGLGLWVHAMHVRQRQRYHAAAERDKNTKGGHAQ